jgi:hypothetical protein
VSLVCAKPAGEIAKTTSRTSHIALETVTLHPGTRDVVPELEGPAWLVDENMLA